MSYLATPLLSSHKKKTFSCGKPLPDQYLQYQARQDVKRKITACFVLADDEQDVKGYYTLSSATIERKTLPEAIAKKLPPGYQNLPAILLGRLAVSRKHQGKRLGELLLLDALYRCLSISSEIGSLAVIVDPLDKQAENFYLRYGFILLPDSAKMFLPMATVAKLFS